MFGLRRRAGGARSNGNGSSAGGGAQPALIHMRGVTKTYDTGKIKVEALKEIDLEVRANEFISIVGPSGSGKSTLMNILGCLDTASGGSYALGGEEVSGLDLDRLATTGVRFRTCYTAAICHPTRFMLMTGRTARATGSFTSRGGVGDRSPPTLRRTSPITSHSRRC